MDDVFSMLADIHRRRLLVALLEYNPQSDDPPTVPDTIHRGEGTKFRVHAALIHNHLPMLEGARVIQWDQDTGTVHKGPRFEEIQPLLEWLNENADDLPGEWV